MPHIFIVTRGQLSSLRQEPDAQPTRVTLQTSRPHLGTPPMWTTRSLRWSEAISRTRCTAQRTLNLQLTLILDSRYRWVFENQQSNNSQWGLNQNCLKALGRGNALCFFPEYSLQYMTTPMFVLNSGYDSWQTNFIWFTPNGGKPVDPGWHSCAQVVVSHAKIKPIVLTPVSGVIAHTPFAGHVHVQLVAACADGNFSR